MASRHPVTRKSTAPKVRSPRQALEVRTAGRKSVTVVVKKPAKRPAQDNRPPARKPAPKPVKEPRMTDKPKAHDKPETEDHLEAPAKGPARGPGKATEAEVDHPKAVAAKTGKDAPEAKQGALTPTPLAALTDLRTEAYCQQRAVSGSPGNQTVERAISAMIGGSTSTTDLMLWRDILGGSSTVRARLTELGGVPGGAVTGI